MMWRGRSYTLVHRSAPSIPRRRPSVLMALAGERGLDRRYRRESRRAPRVPWGNGLGRAAVPCGGVGMARAVLGHDVCNEPCKARLGTDVARLLRAATDPAHPPAVGTGLGMRLASPPCDNGWLPGRNTGGDPGASL